MKKYRVLAKMPGLPAVRFIAYGGMPVLPDGYEVISDSSHVFSGNNMYQLQASLSDAAKSLKAMDDLIAERKNELKFLESEMSNLRKTIGHYMSEQSLDNVVTDGLLLSCPDDDEYKVSFTHVTIL